MVSPAIFVPIAEQNGLIHSISYWVLETACQQIKSWHDKGFKGLRKYRIR
ncbi:MAG: EAL domain-containing protein [Clostridiales bacterium]|nr:EAL domain-containing protein [Clostridiales bacterium]